MRPGANRAGRPAFGSLLPVSACSALCVVLAVLYADGLAYIEGNLWFLLDIGKDFVEQGIQYDADSFSVFPGCSTVIQQWLYAVALYAAFSAFGHRGVYALCGAILLLVFALAGLLLRRLLPRGSFRWPSAFAFMVLAVLLSLSSSMHVRPSLASSAIWLGVFLAAHVALERGDWRFLAAFPLLCALHVNIHASMVPYDFAVLAAALLCPTVHTGPSGRVLLRLSGARQRLAWFAGASAAGALALLANPYGWRGALYFFLSYGAANTGDIGELYSLSRAFAAHGSDSMIVEAVVVPAVLLVLSSLAWAVGSRGARVPLHAGLLALAALSTAAAFVHIRCSNLEALYCMLAVPLMLCSPPASETAQLPAEGGGGRAPRHGRSALVSACCAVSALNLLVFGVSMCVFGAPMDGEGADIADNSFTPVSAVSHVLEDGGAPEGFEGNSGPSVFADGNSAGLFELAGCRVQMDARPELFAPAITGVGEDYNGLWNSFCSACSDGDAAAALEVVERCGCDYLFVAEERLLNCPGFIPALEQQGSYELVIEVPTPEDSRYYTGYTFWKKVR